MQQATVKKIFNVAVPDTDANSVYEVGANLSGVIINSLMLFNSTNTEVTVDVYIVAVADDTPAWSEQLFRVTLGGYQTYVIQQTPIVMETENGMTIVASVANAVSAFAFGAELSPTL